MESTILIAKLLGVYLAVSGIFIVTRGKTFVRVLHDFFANRAITFLVGAILTVGGAALVYTGSAADDPVSIFVKVVSWLILLKGLAYIFAPDRLHNLGKSVGGMNLMFVGLVTAAIGVYLVFFLK